MVHFDAHPDMSVPTPVNTEHDSILCWNNPQTVYFDVLSSEGCISEFLLPMLYQEWLSNVIWVRSMWCDQISDGSHTFMCGNMVQNEKIGDQRCMVSLSEPYYIDEGVCADTSELVNSKGIQLHVCLAKNLMKVFEQSITALDINEEQSNHGVEWILDICLDYFSTNNPFLAPLKRALAEDTKQACEYDIDSIMKTIQEMYRCFSFRCKDLNNKPEDGHKIEEFISACQRRKLRDHCRRIMSKVLLDIPTTAQSSISDTAIMTEHKQDFLHLFPAAFRACPGEVFYDKILPLMSIKTRTLLHDTGTLVLLPHHLTTQEHVDALMEELTHSISSLRLQRPDLPPPAAITIARSTGEVNLQTHEDDGYTTTLEVEVLQSKVLCALEGLLQNWNEDVVKHESQKPKASRLDVYKLYETDGEDSETDVFDKAYSLFLHSKAKIGVHTVLDGNPCKKGRT